jgi:hypothetical protein
LQEPANIVTAPIAASDNETVMDDNLTAETSEKVEASETAANPADMLEFERLSYASKGDRLGWKFNREDLHQR